MISAVLFDLEGTLVDFQWKLEEAEATLRSALTGLGFEEQLFAGADYAAIRRIAMEQATSSQIQIEVDRRLAPIYDRYDQDALNRWSLREGATDLVQDLAARGLPMALVSNIGRQAGYQVLEKFDLKKWFRLVVAREDVSQMKPSGEGIRKALDTMKVSPTEAVMVGDSLTDLRAARDSGVRVLLISGGETLYRGLGDAAPDYRVSSLREVAAVLFPASMGT